MDPRDALDLTIRIYKLKASDLARDSNLSPEVISRYRHKKQDLQAENLFKVIKVMPEEARHYFIDLSCGKKMDMPLPV